MNKQAAGRLVELLLGPSTPEIGCEECFHELDRYVDLQLSGSDANGAVPGMVAHLKGCPACHEDQQSLHALAGDETTSTREEQA